MRIMGTVLMIIQVGVDYRGKNTVKSVQNEKYSAKSADFLRFLLYLCHAIDPEPLGFAACPSKNFLLLRYL